MRLAVTSLSTRPVQRMLPAPVGGRGHRTSERNVLLVDVHGEAAGRRWVGRGEAAPLPGLSLDSLAEAGAALSGFTATLPLSFELDGTLSSLVEQRCVALPPSARAAVEAALLDLAAQALERPVWRLLRDTPAHALSLAALVDLDAASLNERLDALAAEGIRTVKCKVVGPALRNVAARFALRVDPNRAYSPAAFASLAPALHALRPELVEEPVDADFAGWLVDGAATLPPLPYAIDESLGARDSAAALRAFARFRPAVDAGRVAAIVLKPSRDGIFGALALAHRAAALGIPTIVTHFWDGTRAHLAACHVALALSTPVSRAQGLALYTSSAGDLGALLQHGTLGVARAAGLGAVGEA
jgi:L-alanine-DL-glutamate epimerase-like enolase superfamily enzyme